MTTAIIFQNSNTFRLCMHISHKNFCRMLEPPARSAKNRFYVSAFADFESTSEKVFSRAHRRTRSINRVCEIILYRIHLIFIETIRVHIFRKHPRKLAIRTLRFRAMRRNRECLPYIEKRFAFFFFRLQRRRYFRRRFLSYLHK